MTKNPFLNASAAVLYIVAVVLLIFYGGPLAASTQETIFIPMAMLSLFVLSASVMAYIFLYNPALMAIEGKYKEATSLFLTTVAVFAVATIALFLIQALFAPYLPASHQEQAPTQAQSPSQSQSQTEASPSAR